MHSFPCYRLCVVQIKPRHLELDLATSLLDDWQLALRLPGLTSRQHLEHTFCSKQQARRCAEQVVEAIHRWQVQDSLAEMASDANLELGLKYLSNHSDLLAQAARDGDDLSSCLRAAAGPLAPQLAEFAVHHWSRPPSQEPDELRDFLADLREGEPVHSRGRFSLESGRARKKLQALQLLQPEEFVVHVVGAAIAEGAPEIAVHVDSDEVIVDFDSPPLSRGDLEGLFASLLSGEMTEHPGLPELAVALNAAAGLKPARLYLDAPGHRLEVTASNETVLPNRRLAGHRFYFRAPLGLKVVKRFVKGLSGPRPEELLLEQRCQHAPVPLLVNKRSLSSPLPAGCMGIHLRHPSIPLWTGDSATIEERQSPLPFSAWMALGPPPGLEVTIYGVIYEAPDLPWTPCLAIYLAAPMLSRSLSRAQVTASIEFRAVSTYLQEAQDEVMEKARQLATREDRPDVVAALLGLLVQGLVPEAASWPLLPVVGGGDRVSVQRLQREPTLLFTLGVGWTEPPRNRATVVRITEGSQTPLQRLVPGLKSDSGDKLLAQARRYREKETAWLRLPASPLSVVGECLARLDSRFGQLALPAELHGPLPRARVELCRQKRLLFVEDWPWLPGGLVAVLNHDDLQPDDDWETVLENHAWQELQADARRSVAPLYRQLEDQLKESPLARLYAQALVNLTLDRRSPFAGQFAEWRQIPLYTMPDGTLQSHDQLFPGE